PPRAPPSFPTRRSSDLWKSGRHAAGPVATPWASVCATNWARSASCVAATPTDRSLPCKSRGSGIVSRPRRIREEKPVPDLPRGGCFVRSARSSCSHIHLPRVGRVRSCGKGSGGGIHCLTGLSIYELHCTSTPILGQDRSG